MRVEDETELSKALLGDSEARRALARRAAATPELAAELQPFERAWEQLELPRPADAPPGFAARTAALAAEERLLLPGFTLSPAWAGVAAAVLVAVGVAGGTGLGAYALPEDESEGDAVFEQAGFWADDGLLDEQLFDDDSPVDPASGASTGADEVAP